MKRTISKNTFLLILLIASIIGFLVFLKTNSAKIPNPDSLSTTNRNTNLKLYASKDLKISFEYSQDWYIDDRYQRILVANYETNQNKDEKPNNEQIKILIRNFNGCHDTIEENLVDPGCGEGGPSVNKNNILFKESRQTQGGTFYKYIVESPSNKFTYYLLEHNNTVLQISKTPDPSQFEKEFEDLVNSIRFVD